MNGAIENRFGIAGVDDVQVAIGFEELFGGNVDKTGAGRMAGVIRGGTKNRTRRA